MEEDGRFFAISNYPEQLDFYYQEKLFHKDQYLVHPKLMRSGYALIPLTPDPHYLELSRKLHRMNHLYLIHKRKGNRAESFYFTGDDINASNSQHLIDQTDLLVQLGQYFKREAKRYIIDAKQGGYNARQAMGDAFFVRDENAPLSNAICKKFLRTISLLSPREQECLDLCQEGNSARNTAAILGISFRTIEHYLESIKDKLGCASKQDLRV